MAKRVLRLEIECEDGSRPASSPVVVDFRGAGSAGNNGAVRLSIRGDACEVTHPGARSAHAMPPGQWCEAGGVRLRVAPANAARDAIESNPNFTGFEIRGRAMEQGKARSIQCSVPGVEGSQFVIGRKAGECDLVVNDRHVSGRHVRLFVREGRVMVEDLQSRWGTAVQGMKLLNARALQDGDVVTFGNSSFQFINHLERILRAPGVGPSVSDPAAAPAAVEGGDPEAARSPPTEENRTALHPPAGRSPFTLAAQRLERTWPVALTVAVAAILAWLAALLAGEAIWSWLKGIGDRAASWF